MICKHILLIRFYLSAEMQSVYSTASTRWADKTMNNEMSDMKP